MTARRRALLRVAPLLSLALLGAGVAGCSSGPATAPAMRDISALLARHGTAVMQHDRAAFVADLDTAAKAASFRDEQLGEYPNLVQLPLTKWTYHVESRTDDREAEATASHKYGTPAVIVRIELQYGLRGVDPIPTNHEVWWTFVRSGGRVVIAGDDDLADAGGTSWQGPWDFGPLTVVHGARSLVLGHPGDGPELRSLASTVDAAVPAVSAVWGTDWSQDVAVIVPSSQDELAAQVGQAADLTTQVAAAATADGSDALTGAVYGQRLIVNPAALARLSDIGQQITVRHEITHIATARATGDATPRWVAEGFADYVGNLNSGQPPKVVAAELRTDVVHGRAPTALPSESDFDTGSAQPQAYEGAWLACRLIAQRAGQAGLVRFYKLVGASSDDSDQAVAAGLRAVLHETTARFTAQWRQYVLSTLR